MANDANPGVAAPEDLLPLDREETSRWQRLVEPVARLATPAPEEEEAFRLRFLHAGLRQRTAPALFYAAKVLLALGLPMLLAAGWTMSGRAGPGLPAMLMAAFVGLYLPQLWLHRRTRLRQRELFEVLPDAIDLLVVCTEAGLGLEAALARVERELRLRSQALSDELSLLAAELRLGQGRAQALRNLARRTGLEEARLLVAALVQADRFGLGIADALRVHAQDLRLSRQRRAEEEAAKLPLKLLFPLIFALFPALMVVLLGPAAIGLMRQMLPLMGGR